MEKKTALYDKHVAAGGRMVPFAGYLLPVQYADGIISEHMAVREKAGLFDVSHMAEAMLSGPGALATLNMICTNAMETLQPGRVRYSPMCNAQGGIVDDILVYCLAPNEYLLVLNAANHQKDIDWIRANLQPDTRMADISDDYAQLALQGPEAEAILRSMCIEGELPQKYYTFTQNATVHEIPCLLSRTGYTGEDGFELYVSPQCAPLLWDHLVSAGAKPCGLGARDTLRLEAAMPLYGHELADDISPREAKLDAFVKMEKPDFIGKAALEAAGPPKRLRAGLMVTGRGIAREDCEISIEGKPVGRTTSGTMAPYLRKAIAMALVDAEHTAPGTEVTIDIRGREVTAEITALPFYKRGKK